MLRTQSDQKAKDIRTHHYLAAAMARDPKMEILSNAKELLMEMKVDIDVLDPASSPKFEWLLSSHNLLRQIEAVKK